MDFILKNVELLGQVKPEGSGIMAQDIHIQIGILNCPYDDISAFRRVKYLFSENLTAKQVEDNLIPFAQQWILENYPNT